VRRGDGPATVLGVVRSLSVQLACLCVLLPTRALAGAISLHLAAKDADVHQIAVLVGGETHENILVAPDVSGTVTGDFDAEGTGALVARVAAAAGVDDRRLGAFHLLIPSGSPAAWSAVDDGGSRRCAIPELRRALAGGPVPGGVRGPLIGLPRMPASLLLSTLFDYAAVPAERVSTTMRGNLTVVSDGRPWPAVLLAVAAASAATVTCEGRDVRVRGEGRPDTDLERVVPPPLRDDETITDGPRVAAEDWRLVATLTGGARASARLIAPDGTGKTVVLGSAVGDEWGEVAAITPGRVVVLEDFRTAAGDVLENTVEYVLGATGARSGG